MTVRVTRIRSGNEHKEMCEDALDKGWYRNDTRMFLPGMAWFMPWCWDHTGERTKRGCYVMAERGNTNYLSSHYWNEWADKRDPICIVCPNGEQWEIDRKSSNGSGWQVTCPDWSAEFPLITCSPSVVVTGYHGFLRDGVFTADLEGRPPNGVARPESPLRSVEDIAEYRKNNPRRARENA